MVAIVSEPGVHVEPVWWVCDEFCGFRLPVRLCSFQPASVSFCLASSLDDAVVWCLALGLPPRAVFRPGDGRVHASDLHVPPDLALRFLGPMHHWVSHSLTGREPTDSGPSLSLTLTIENPFSAQPHRPDESFPPPVGRAWQGSGTQPSWPYILVVVGCSAVLCKADPDSVVDSITNFLRSSNFPILAAAEYGRAPR